MLPCIHLLCAEPNAAGQSERTRIALEALSRLKGIDLEANPAVKTAVLKVLASTKGTPQFVEIVRDFQIKGQCPALLAFALKNPADATGVEAMRLVLASAELDLIKNSLNSTNASVAARTVEAVGNTGEKQVVPLLEPLVTETKRDVRVRKQAIRSLAQIQEGAAVLLRLAKEDRLPGDIKFVATTELNNVRWSALKAEAGQLLPLPQGQNAQALPPLNELLQRPGDAKHGAEVFAREEVSCLKCHQVNGQGMDFGPPLSEIGTKLGKDALYESILDPSAGISFGYEAWQIELKNGDEAFGLIVSETADELSVKAQTGVISKYKKSDIVKREQQKSSIMPTGLQATMSTQELVDLVEYLASLKKAP